MNLGTTAFDPMLHPELAALAGVPQPAEHHPEIDTLVHIRMVMAQVHRLSSDRRVHFAALAHDLGKGLTPVEMLPKHIDHEERGVPLVRGLGERLGVSEAEIKLGEEAALWHTHVHRATVMSSKGLRSFFRDFGLVGPLDKHGKPTPLDADTLAERTDAFDVLLLVAEADARGRLGFENREYYGPAMLRAALTAYREGRL